MLCNEIESKRFLTQYPDRYEKGGNGEDLESKYKALIKEFANDEIVSLNFLSVFGKWVSHHVLL